MAFVLIPGGEFWMGSREGDEAAWIDERPRHRVRVAPFYCGIAPVLQREWDRVMEPNGSYFKGATRPVERVTWGEARAFAGRSGRRLRLLSEAEWEYAARGGSGARYWWGDEHSHRHAGEVRCPGETTEVEGMVANPYGLLDMLGNVQEWCLDFWHSSYEGAPGDGEPWRKGGDWKLRVVRGGSWLDDPAYERCSYRDHYALESSSYSIGFRCAVPALVT